MLDALAQSAMADTATPTAATHSAFYAPRLSLAACVRAYLSRSTLGAELAPAQRYNYFPAAPMCAIQWIIKGVSIVVQRGDERVYEPVPTQFFIGPHTAPIVSFNPGPVQGFMLALTPDAVQAMTGVDMSQFVDRQVPLRQVFDAAWQAMAQMVMDAPDDAVRIQLIEAFLEPRWVAVRSGAMPRADRYRLWAEGLALRAATSGVGQSLRQIERRIKAWAGLPLRDLRRFSHLEAAYFQVRQAQSSASFNWADAAADAGFADQAHLCRETRRITGLTPTELRRAIDEDECFWVYRIVR
jgi:AraC-like DNA-binding protein